MNTFKIESCLYLNQIVCMYPEEYQTYYKAITEGLRAIYLVSYCLT